jgi:surfeit locus 1 family protein
MRIFMAMAEAANSSQCSPPAAGLPGARPVWLPTLAAVLVAGLTALLGQWQWRKAEAKEAARTGYEHAAALPALAWRDAAALGEAALYRRVRLTGEFMSGYQILLDNRVQAGRAGYHAVLPLRLEEGGTVLVNRGWLAVGGDRSQPPEVAAPRGRQAMEGILVHARARYLELGPRAGAGAVWQNLDLDRYRAWAGMDLPDLLLLQTAPAGDGLLRDWPGPDTGAARHRAYAVQWFSLCALTVGLWGWFAVWRRRAAG